MTISAAQARQLLQENQEDNIQSRPTSVPSLSPQQAQQLLEQHGIKEPIAKAPPQSIVEEMFHNPIVNAGVSAGQSLGQAIYNAMNASADFTKKYGHHLLHNPAIQLALPGSVNLGAAFDKVIDTIARHHLRTPEVALPGALSTKIGQVLGQLPLFAAGGEAGEAALGAAKAAPIIGRGLEAVEQAAQKIPLVGRMIPQAAQRATGAAITGAALEPQTPGRGAAQMAALSPLADIGAAALGKGVQTIGRPLLSPVLATKRVTQNLLRRFFSKHAYPFVKDHLNKILDELKGTSSPEASNEDILNRINQHFEELKGDSSLRNLQGLSNSYVEPGTSVGDAYAAVPSDMPINKSLYNSQINKKIEGLQNNLKRLSATSGLRGTLENRINTLNDFKNIALNNYGDAKAIKEIINNHIRELPYGDPLRSDLHDIKDKGLFAAISDSAQKAKGKYQLYGQTLKDADRRYADEIVPFKEIAKGKTSPFMQRYLGKKQASGLISEYLKPGAQKDQADLLHKLIKISPPDEGATRRLIAYDYLKGSEDNPGEMLKRWNKLGPKQKALLLPEYSEELNQFAKLAKQSPSAFREPKEPGQLGKLALSAELLGGTGLGMVHPAAAIPFLVHPVARLTAKKILETPAGQELFLKDLADKGILSHENMLHHRNALRNIILSAAQQEREKK